jgi:hypothetical protein
MLDRRKVDYAEIARDPAASLATDAAYRADGSMSCRVAVVREGAGDHCFVSGTRSTAVPLCSHHMRMSARSCVFAGHRHFVFLRAPFFKEA